MQANSRLDLPTLRPFSPFSPRESTPDPRNRNTASGPDPRASGREVKRAVPDSNPRPAFSERNILNVAATTLQQILDLARRRKLVAVRSRSGYDCRCKICNSMTVDE